MSRAASPGRSCTIERCFTDRLQILPNSGELLPSIAIQNYLDGRCVPIGRESGHRYCAIELNRVANPTLVEIDAQPVLHMLKIYTTRFKGSFWRFAGQAVALQAMKAFELLR